MRNAGGYLIGVRDDERKLEVDSFTCAHCNSVVWVRAKQRAEDLGGHCRMCNKPICPNCAGIGSCTPFERKLEAMEANDAALKSYGMD